MNNDSDDDSDVEDEVITDEAITQKLANWATTYRIQQCAAGSLLAAIRIPTLAALYSIAVAVIY